MRFPFSYDVGMMNEFYELKPGETVRNVLMYNSPTVILTSLGKKTNFSSEEELKCNILVSHYGNGDLVDAQLNIKLSIGGKIAERKSVRIDSVPNGKVSDIYSFTYTLPVVKKPAEMKLYITLDSGEVFAENQWELYLFPKVAVKENNIVVSKGMELEELTALLENGKDVLILGTKPFVSIPTTFRIGLAGRTSGNLATVVNEHPVLKDMPHEGYCSWQFAQLMENANAICFESPSVPFEPIIEVVSTHKYAIRQAALFEFNVEKGRLLVCSFDFKKHDIAAQWLLSQIIDYMQSDNFIPEYTIDKTQLTSLANCKVVKPVQNSNFAFDCNDKTARGRL